MPQLTIYQKPTCSTCRDVMRHIKDAGIDYDAIDYIIEPPSREKLAQILRKMRVPARDLLRTKEREYLELGLDNPDLTDDQILDAIAAHPILLQRPILVYGRHAALARPADRVAEVLRKWKIE